MVYLRSNLKIQVFRLGVCSSGVPNDGSFGWFFCTAFHGRVSAARWNLVKINIFSIKKSIFRLKTKTCILNYYWLMCQATRL